MGFKDTLYAACRGYRLRANVPEFNGDWHGPTTAEIARSALTGPDAFPPLVRVVPGAFVTSRHPCCDMHTAARFGSVQYVVQGLGRVILTGCVGPDEELCGDGPGYALPDAGLMADIAAGKVDPPGPLAGMPMAFRVAWVARRLAFVLPALVVQWWGASGCVSRPQCPLLARESLNWNWNGDRLTSCKKSGTVLTDPTTY